MAITWLHHKIASALANLRQGSLTLAWAPAVSRLLVIVLLVAPIFTQSDIVLSATGSPRGRVASLSCAGFYHAVRPGETIYSIAGRYRTSAYRIAVCNGLRSYRVYVGQVLRVPAR